MARIGILGGTFNPPHVAHLICAQEAAAQLGLDTVTLLPAGRPPHKPVEDEPGAEHRLAMCALAAAGDQRLMVSRMEIDRPGPSYTLDTLKALGERGDQELTFIVGGDMAASLPDWHEPEAVLALARLAVAERAGARRERILRAVAGLRGVRERLCFLDVPRVDISSSMVRARVGAGRPIRYLVCDAVADYIAAHGLYRGAGEVGA